MTSINYMLVVIFGFMGGCAGTELSPTIVANDALLIWSAAPQVGE